MQKQDGGSGLDGQNQEDLVPNTLKDKRAEVVENFKKLQGKLRS